MAGEASGSDKGGLSIRQNMLWNSAGSIVSLGCQWAITVLIVRLSSGYGQAGVYSLAMSVYGIFNPLAQYRLYTYQVSDVEGEYSLGEYFSFRLIAASVAIILTFGYALLTCPADAVVSIMLYALYKVLGLVIDVFHGSDQVFHRMDYIGKSLTMQGVSSLALFVIFFSTTGSLELAIVAMCAATALIALFYDVPRACALTEFVPGISRAKTLRLALRCLPIVIAGIACSAAPALPRQYLSASEGTAALGAYASMAAPVAIIQMGVSYIYNPLLSYYSESYAARNRSSFLKLVGMTIAGACGVGIVCAVGLEFLGGPLLSLVYGEGILAYLYLLQPLILLAVLTGLMWFVNDLLIALRNFCHTFIGSIVALVVSAASTIPAVRMLGLNGVTAATMASCVAGAAYMAVALAMQVHHHFKETGEAE